MAISAKIIDAVEPDLVDINFGCPVKKVVSKGAGAGVLKDIDLMVKLTKAVVKSTHLPVTVKTRLGWDFEHINIDEVAERLQEAGIKALTIHARTRSQMYKGEADWAHILRIKENPNIEIPIFGNGDIDLPEKALKYKDLYKPDGIMIGRAAIGNPWIFNQIKHFFQTGERLPEPDLNQRLEAVKRHAEWSAAWKGEKVGLLEMRRHYGNYFRAVANFKTFKTRFLHVETLAELEDLIGEISNLKLEI
jgi:nifR3 family TIM-barrel protein